MQKDTKELKFLKHTTHKVEMSRFETKDSIYMYVGTEKGVWLNKKYVFPSNYSNYVTISIVEDWDYKVYSGKDQYEIVKGKELFEFLENAK